MPDEMVIRLYLYSIITITTEEYDELVRELEIKQLTGTITKGDQILANLLHDRRDRYHEILHIRAVREGRYVSPRE